MVITSQIYPAVLGVKPQTEPLIVKTHLPHLLTEQRAPVLFFQGRLSGAGQILPLQATGSP